VIESAGLAAVASGVVMAATHWLFPHLLALLSESEASNYPAILNPRTLACLVLLTLVASVATVLVPVWRLFRSEINPGLKGGDAAGDGRGMTRMRGAFVVLQAALAIVLLAGTGLMVRSFERLHQVDLGFDPVGLVRVVISFPHVSEGFLFQEVTPVNLSSAISAKFFRGAPAGVHLKVCKRRK